jgi:hypothetical protein
VTRGRTAADTFSAVWALQRRESDAILRSEIDRNRRHLARRMRRGDTLSIGSQLAAEMWPARRPRRPPSKSTSPRSSSLNIVEHTVKNHIKRILSKLDADDRTGAAMIAVRRGYIDLSENP